jgi:hypothetical protein
MQSVNASRRLSVRETQLRGGTARATAPAAVLPLDKPNEVDAQGWSATLTASAHTFCAIARAMSTMTEGKP